LLYGTQKENFGDAIRNAGPDGKYIDLPTREKIRSLYKENQELSTVDVARMCGVSSASVCSICSDILDPGRSHRKISNEDVRRMRELRHCKGWLLSELAERFGVDESNVSRICNGLQRVDAGGIMP
jgi:DNA-directed RNA polymerase specialized sigma24 family protein